MNSTDDKKLLAAIDRIHKTETWAELGQATPEILNSLIGADLSCWSVTDLNGNCLELKGGREYEHIIAEVTDALFAHQFDHPILREKHINQGISSPGEFRLSDFISWQEFQQTGLYREAFRHFETKYQILSQVLVEGGMEVTIGVNRRSRDFNERSLKLLGSVKLSMAITCRRILREREMVERIALLMEHASDLPCPSVLVDENGRILEKKGGASGLLATRFGAQDGHLPVKLLEQLTESTPHSISSRSSVHTVKDEYGESLILTCLRTGGGTRRTILFHPKKTSEIPGNPFDVATTSLSARQQEVLRWISEGKTNGEIAMLLNIAPRTVDKHCENIYEKLGVENRLAAARKWIQSGK